MEFEKFMKAQALSDAKLGFTEALATGETPEQAAMRLQKARTFNVAPAAVEIVSPEEEAAHRADLVDWAALQVQAPELLKRLNDPAFATLVKDDLPNQGALEAALWKLSPEGGVPDSTAATFGNSLFRGIYSFFGQNGRLANLSEQLDALNKTELAIAEGKSNAELFGTETDPSGEIGRRVFDQSKAAQREGLLRQLREAADQTAWAVRMQRRFPMSEAGQRFSQAEGLGESVRAFLDSPLQILTDLGPESFAQFAPALAGMALLGGAGAPVGAQMAASGVSSFAVDKSASIGEGLQDLGIDFTDPDAIFNFVANPDNRGKIEELTRQASLHAAGTALFDALSAGVAEKMLVPKALTRTVIDTAYKREFANMFVQMPVQGAMGGAGEALGQYLSDGEITSWSDIIAEVAGEHFTAPVEVFSTGMRVRAEAEAETRKAEAKARAATEAGQAVANSTAAELDPETVTEQVRRVAEISDSATVSFDAQAFHQLGLDEKFSDVPGISEQMQTALATGGDITIPMETYVMRIAPRDEGGQAAGLASFSQAPSLEEARAQEAEVDSATEREVRAARDRASNEFREELSAVGKAIGKDLRGLGIEREEASGLQAVIQTAVGAAARDSGYSPRKLWEKYGVRFTDDPAAVNGDAFSMSSPEWGGTFAEFVANADEKTRFVADMPKTPDELRSFIADNWSVPANSVEVQVTKDARVHDEEHNLSEADWLDIVNLPEEFTDAEVSRGRLWLYRKRNDGRVVAGVFAVSHSPKRARIGKGAEVRLGLVTGYTTTEEGLKNELAKQRAQSERSDHTVVGRRLPTVTTKIERGYYTEGENRSVGSSSLSRRLAKVPGGFKQNENAIGEYFPSLRLIARWKNADRSTLLHETGHFFLDFRFRVARDLLGTPEESRTDQQKAFIQHAQRVLEWFGVKSLDDWFAMSVDEQRPYHEKFARSFEAYVMEGRAPVTGLKKVFRSFARWLKQIYTVIANIPGAELNEDVREMFDALFLSDDQIRAALIRQNAQPMLSDPESAGMSPVEWIEYTDAQGDMVSDARAEQSTRDVRAIRAIQAVRRRLYKDLKSEANTEAKRIREEEKKKVEQTHSYRAWKVLRHGTVYEGKAYRPKLFFGDLEMLGYTKDEIRLLHEAHLASKQAYRQPVSLNDLAMQLDYANGNELVDDMLAHLDWEKEIDDRTVNRMIAEHPRLANAQRLQETAEAALYNDAKLVVLQTELAAMERRLGRTARALGPLFDDLAYRLVNGMRYVDLKPRVYVQAATRAARNARNAWAKGNVEAAIFFKRQEIYQSAMAKNAKEALTESAKNRAKLSRFRKKQIRGIDTRFLVVIQHALNDMGFYSREQLSLNPYETDSSGNQQTFSTVLKSLESDTEQAFDASVQLIEAISTGKVDYLSTPEGFRNFMDLINQLEVRGRMEQQIRVNNELRDLALVQSEAVTSILKVADQHNRSATKQMEEETREARFTDFLEKFGFNHARAASLAAVLDGGWVGKITELLIYPADKAATKEGQLKNKYAVRLDKILKPVMARLRKQDPKTSVVLNRAFTTQQAFVALLNWGNEGNRQRMIATVKYMTGRDLVVPVNPSDPVSVAQAQAEADEVMGAFFREYLDEDMLKAAQQIWDLFDEIRTETDKVAKSILGRSPVWVQPRPFRIGDTEMRGGYYPIVYDRLASLSGARIAGLEDAKGLMPVFGNSKVDDGHLQSRVKAFDRPLVMTTRAMFEGIDQQIHYIAWAQWSNDARKVLNPNDKIAQAIKERYGVRYVQALDDWMKDCITGGDTQATSIDGIANILRRNVSLAGIGLNLSTAFLQVLGVTQSVAYLGPKWIGRGISEYLRMGPKKAYDWVSAKSEMMQDRMRTQFREVAEIQSQLNGTTGALKEKFMRAAYLPLTMMQMTVDVPTWLGAYQKAVAEGRSEELAIADADRAVANAQGSGRVSDLSPYERGNAWAKLFTVFYTFFNTALNLAVVSGKTKTAMKAAFDIAMVLAVQPVLETFVKAGASAIFGGGDDEDDDWMKNTLKNAGVNMLQFNLGLLVGVRELSWVLGEFGYQGPAGLRKITDTGRGIRAVERAIETGEWDESTLRAVVSAAGVWAGLPVTPINRAIQGGNALLQDKTDNPLALFIGYKENR